MLECIMKYGGMLLVMLAVMGLCGCEKVQDPAESVTIETYLGDNETEKNELENGGLESNGSENGGSKNCGSENSGSGNSGSERGKELEYPALAKQEIIELEGADNPAGFLQDACSNMMVQVFAGNLYGSGVIVASDQSFVWIATAGHVVENMEDAVKIVFVDGYETKTSYVQRLDTQDIAILKVPRKNLVKDTGDAGEGADDHGLGYRVANLSQTAFDEMGVGDLVIAMGCRSGVGEDAYAGTISQDYVYLEDFGAYMIVAEVVATPGMSGGGLFDVKGRLLGIICGISEEGEVAVSSIMSILALDLTENL